MPLPGLIDGVEPEAQGHNPVFCDTKGNLYRVTEERLAGGNNPQMMKSSDGGVTWAAAGVASQPTGSSLNDLESGWCFQAGTVIGFVWTDDTDLFYLTFNTSDAASNPDTWQLVEVPFEDLNGGSRAQASVARLSDGRIRTVFTNLDGAGQLALATKSTTTSAGGWSGKTALATGSDNFLGGSIVVGESDTLHIFTHNVAGRTVLHRTLTSADVLSANTRVDTAGTNPDSANYHAVSNPIYYDVAGAEVVTILYAASTGVRSIQLVNGAATDSLVTSAAVAIAPAGTEGSTGADNAHFHLAVDGTTLHAIWVDDASGDLLHSSRLHGGSWATPDTLWASGGSYGYWCYANVYSRSGSKVLGYTYDVGPHSDDGHNIHYNELTLAVPPAEGSVSGSWSFAGTATGARQPQGSGSGSWAFTGSAAGTTARTGSGSASTAWVGTGLGDAPEVGVSDGSGVGEWSFAGAGVGVRQAAATGTAATAWAGAGAGAAPSLAAAEGSGGGSWAFTGSAAATAVVAVWTGTTWQPVQPVKWTGTAWVDAPLTISP